ncbi:RadC family protein [Devosia riboflavina]|uniref:RadC family protein n=1 Tax=Devosia riboflavina TaxID=46914 RepID=UPI00068D123C|nr:DNA repair protein RadC [Devosia riboflavina]
MQKNEGLAESSVGPFSSRPPILWDRHTQERMLSNLLRPSLGVRGSKLCARALLERFGSLPQVLAAPAKLVMEIEGIGVKTASHLALTLSIAQHVAKDNLLNDRPILSSWSELIEYCRAAMAFESVEQLRILFLDRKNRLIIDEVMQVGTVDHTQVYPREVVRRSLDFSASAIILVHNHPSGDPSPSAADVRMTREIEEAAKPLRITLHDHIIVGRNGHRSLRGLKLI